eukprot:12089504-Alexandrium_andersonii.AAC.1
MTEREKERAEMEPRTGATSLRENLSAKVALDHYSASASSRMRALSKCANFRKLIDEIEAAVGGMKDSSSIAGEVDKALGSLGPLVAHSAAI